jgi:prepilin-type N-terminal cleavage/methylation domain-containing protein
MLFSKRNFNRGFTLVELLVTISIFVILTGIVLFNQTKFNSTILLTNLAYDTALTVRQAQTYGINIKEFNSTGNSDGGEFLSYGVHFEKGAKSFILFTDLDSNDIFDGATTTCQKSEGCVTRYNIKRGNYIKDICAEALTASSSVCGTSLTNVNTVFVRPNPDAVIKSYINNTVSSEYAAITIILGGVEQDSTRKVVVRRNGLIEIIN